MAKTREYHALLAACIQEGCLLCRMVQENTQRYLDAWKYELFTDVMLREELRRTQGFCHTHTWQLAQMGATLPLAQAYRDVVTDTIEQLQNGKHEQNPASGGLLRRFFAIRRDRPTCPACRRQTEAEARYAHSLRQAFSDDEFYQQFSVSHGLCLDHFRLTCTLKAGATPGEWLPRLQQAQLTCLQRLDEQLVALIRKHDYRFKDEERGPEMSSWQRAAAFVAGEEQRP